MERRVLLAVQLSDLGIQIRKDSGGIRAGRKPGDGVGDSFVSIRKAHIHSGQGAALTQRKLW